MAPADSHLLIEVDVHLVRQWKIMMRFIIIIIIYYRYDSLELCAGSTGRHNVSANNSSVWVFFLLR